MDTYKAIMTRRSVPKTAEAVPRHVEVKRLLEAAVMAPNHHLTEPWRLVVLTGDALKGALSSLCTRSERAATWSWLGTFPSGMAFSSVSVVMNSLRLKRFNK